MNSYEDTLKNLIGGMTVNPAAQAETVERQAVYLDRSETTDRRWKALVSERLKTAKTFEIHCWSEESEWIQVALQYGELRQTNWVHGKDCRICYSRVHKDAAWPS